MFPKVKDQTIKQMALYGMAKSKSMNGKYQDCIKSAEDMLKQYPKSAKFFDLKFLIADSYTKLALTDAMTVGRGYWIKTNQASQTVDIEEDFNGEADCPGQACTDVCPPIMAPGWVNLAGDDGEWWSEFGPTPSMGDSVPPSSFSAFLQPSRA